MTIETATHLLNTFHPAPPNTYSGSWEYGLADQTRRPWAY